MTTAVANVKVSLPAHLAAFADLGTGKDLTSNVGVSYPVLSLKGKVWAIVRGGERELVLNADKEPRASIEAVIIKANPALAKVYYASGYEEGSAEKPDCYSNDGVAPEADAVTPQCSTCPACPHNVWGSKIGEAGQKLKACTDSRRIAVAPLGALNDPMLVRVPAASLKPLAEYGEAFDKKGIPYQAAITKIGFDPEASSPKLTFKFMGFLNAEQATEVRATMDAAVVRQIVGLDKASTQPVSTPATKPATTPPPTVAKPAADAEAVKAAAAAKVAEKKAAAEKAASEKAAAEAKAAEKKPEAPAKAQVIDDLEAALEAALKG